MLLARIRALIAHRERGAVATGVAIAVGGLAVAASLIAVSVTSAGFASSWRLSQAYKAALDQTTAGVQVQGPAVAHTDGLHVTSLQLDVALRPGSADVALVHGASGALRLRYVSNGTVGSDLPYIVATTSGASPASLAPGESAAIIVDLRGLAPPPGPGDRFSLELLVADGVPYTLEEIVPGARLMPPVQIMR